MKLVCVVLSASILALAASSPIVKRETQDDLSPLNETDADSAVDGDHGERDKRKIGIVKLGVTNGILNFVFGKLDAFLDAKTRALSSLDEVNKAKNTAFGIDNTQSATGQFLSNLISQKIQAGTNSIGPLISGATTFVTSAKSGITNALVSKVAPLSSLAGSLTGGLSGGTGSSGGSGSGFGSGSGILGGLLASKVSSLSSLSGTSNLSGGGSGDIGASVGGDTSASAGASSSSSSSGSSSAGAGAGVNLGAFANLGGAVTMATTTEDIPEFDRTRVSLDIPPPVFGGGFSLITNASKVVGSVILNSARRTQDILEALKPLFRGIFAIKGLPSDNPQ